MRVLTLEEQLLVAGGGKSKCGSSKGKAKKKSKGKAKGKNKDGGCNPCGGENGGKGSRSKKWRP